MHGQRAAQAPDHDEQLDELRFGGQQFGEFVEDDEQGGQGRVLVLARQAARLVVGGVGVVARLAQQLLAAHHLAPQGVLHAVHQGELGLQVGDHGGHVRQIRHAGEGRPALEVDQDEVELLGRMGQRHRQDECAQHLRLARAGRADKQAVRPHARLRGLLDVQDHGQALRGHAEGDPQAVAPLAAAPPSERVEVAHVPDIEQVHQIRGALGVRLAHRCLGLGAIVPRPARHAARHGLGLGDADGVGHRQDRAAVPEEDLHRPPLPVPLIFAARVEDQAQGGPGHERPPGCRRAQHGHALGPLRGAEPRAGGQDGVVDDEDHVRPGHGLVARAKGGAGGDVLAEQIGELGRVRRNHAGPAQDVGDLGGPGVRQPLDPLPLPPRPLRAQDGNPQRRRRDEDGQMGEHGAHLRTGRLLGPGHLDMAELPRHDAEGHLVDRGVGGQETAHGRVTHHVRDRQRRQLRFDELHRQILRRRTQAHIEDVRLADLPLPQPSAVLRHQHQGVRIRQMPGDEGALAGGHVPDGTARLGQVGQVLATQAVDRLPVSADLTVDVVAHHGQHGDHHDPAHEEHAGVLTLRHGHEGHDAH